MKIYVASPYETLLKQGLSLKMVIANANFAMIKASCVFAKENVFYSPVIELGYKYRYTKREIVMDMCFNALKTCDVLFIPNIRGVSESKGIYDEYKFALKNGIRVFFDSANLQKEFLNPKAQNKLTRAQEFEIFKANLEKKGFKVCGDHLGFSAIRKTDNAEPTLQKSDSTKLITDF